MRNKTTMASLLVCFIINFFFCNKPENPALYHQPATDTVFYIQSDSDFANPERGFYRATETYADHYETLDVAQMKTWRTLQQADDGNYKTHLQARNHISIAL